MKDQYVADHLIRETLSYENETAYITWQKRTLDFMLVMVSLPVVLVVVGMFWGLNRLNGGSGFFVQKRVGLNGQHFNLLKLRTMHENAEERLEAVLASNPDMRAEWKTKQKLANDPRVTRIGRFMRRTNIDELPQLFNVLKGEMSLVGPRPFLPAQEAMYVSEGGQSYYQMLPGLSGLWQISARSTSNFLVRVKYDEDYARNISLWMDLRIIFRTFPTFLHRTGV